MHSAYHQTKLMNGKKPISRMLASSSLNDEQKRKLRLVEEAKAFGETTLGLVASSNYTTFVQLDQPHVTYIVQAAYARQLKPYMWSFPFVGKVPYKGFFVREMADKEAAEFSPEEYDTYVRGVSAYSTLGWFQDSVLSSMLRYEDHDLVELILHETIHTTLFIKSAAEFNERMATFLGHQGMKQFYLAREGADSVNLKKAENDSLDQRVFSAFITRELEMLKKWYEDQRGSVTAESKAERLREIQTRFDTEVRPKLRSSNYVDFSKRQLNNAMLLAYKTYEYSMADFEKLWNHFGADFRRTLDWLKDLKKSKDPARDLREFVAKL